MHCSIGSISLSDAEPPARYQVKVVRLPTSSSPGSICRQTESCLQAFDDRDVGDGLGRL